MQRLARRYARYRHRQLLTTGHLFERRYKAWVVDTDEYFVTLLRLHPSESGEGAHGETPG